VKTKSYCGICKEYFKDIDKHIASNEHKTAGLKIKQVYKEIDELFSSLKESMENTMLEGTVSTAETDNDWVKEEEIPKENKRRFKETKKGIIEDVKQLNKRRTKVVQDNITKFVEIPNLKTRKPRRKTKGKNENVSNSTLEKYGIYVTQPGVLFVNKK